LNEIEIQDEDLLLMWTEICELVADAGKCSNSLIRYYYEPALRDCRQFVYGGCHGNANRFLTYADCDRTCKQMPQTSGHGDHVEGDDRYSTFPITRSLHCITDW